MKVELGQSVEFAKKIAGRSATAAFLAILPNLIPANAYAENCPIPAAPQKLSVDIEPNTTGSSNGDIPNKNSSQIARISWPPAPGVDQYNVRLTRLDSQTDQRLPDIIINNWYGARIEVRLPYGLFDPQSYAAWVHSVNNCGASEATGITFVNTNPSRYDSKPSPVSPH